MLVRAVAELVVSCWEAVIPVRDGGAARGVDRRNPPCPCIRKSQCFNTIRTEQEGILIITG